VPAITRGRADGDRVADDHLAAVRPRQAAGQAAFYAPYGLPVADGNLDPDLDIMFKGSLVALDLGG
jgi:hypothetical protein